MSPRPTLARRLGTADAVFIGLGSMIGAGVFAVFVPAAKVAGAGLLVGLALAAIVAACNALASAQLATAYPTSGGTYVYGRERLGHWWGFFAGWSFVVGKTASCAAMALVFASYAAPAGWEKATAIAAIVALTAVNYRGITRTAQLTKIIVVLVLTALAVAVAASGTAGFPFLVNISGATVGAASPGPSLLVATGPYALLQSAGLLFFAFAGYARIATLGDEVRNPRRTIPRAIIIALLITITIYAIVGVVLLGTLGAGGLANSTAPLRDAAAISGWGWATPVVAVGAALASLGALLALIAGIARTGLAMAREGDLPTWLASVHPRFHVPHRVEVVVAIVVCGLVLTLDLRGAIGFSSFGVLLYYFVANLSALSQGREHRLFPRAVFVIGAFGCLVLVVTLPLESISGGVAVVLAGVAYRTLRLRR